MTRKPTEGGRRRNRERMRIYYARDPEKFRARTARFKAANRELYNSYERKRQQRLQATDPAWVERERARKLAYMLARQASRDPAFLERRSAYNRRYFADRYHTEIGFAERLKERVSSRGKQIFDLVEREIAADLAAHADEVLVALQQIADQKESEDVSTARKRRNTSPSKGRAAVPRGGARATYQTQRQRPV